MLYTYVCPVCNKLQEVYRPVAEREIPLPCPCGADANRVFDPGVPVIGDDSSWSHSKPEWGIEVRGKSHWEQEMKARGEVPFGSRRPPEMESAVKEAAYVKKHADPSNGVGARAAVGVVQDAAKKLRKKRIKAALD